MCHLPQANRDPDGAIDEAQVEQDAQVSGARADLGIGEQPVLVDDHGGLTVASNVILLMGRSQGPSR